MGSSVKKNKNGVRIGLVSLAGPELFYLGPHTGITINSPEKTLQFLLNQMRQFENPDLVVLMTILWAPGPWYGPVLMAWALAYSMGLGRSVRTSWG